MTINWQIASLGWDDTPRIDLHVNRRETQRRICVRARRKVVGLVCVAGYAVAILCPATMSIVGLHERAAALVVQMKQTDRQIADLKQMATALDLKDQQWKQYQARQRERRSWGDVLATIGATCPAGVYLNRIEVDGAPRTITIDGTSGSTALINNFVQAMQHSGAFSGVTLSNTSTDPAQTGHQLKFEVIADCILPLNGA